MNEDIKTLKDRVSNILKERELKQALLNWLSSQHGAGRRGMGPTSPDMRDYIATYDSQPPGPGITQAEQIVIKFGRPVLTVKDNSFDTAALTANEASRWWQARLDEARPRIEKNIPAVGRINLRNDPTYTWVGTGWLVGPDVVVTNRHVAEVFATKNSDGSYSLRRNFRKQQILPSIDFRMEFESDALNEFPIEAVLHIEEPGGPDVALLRLTTAGASAKAQLADPVSLSPEAPASRMQVGVIGYPGQNSQIPDPDVVRNIFGDIYDVKRLAPGAVMRADDTVIEHDASTLGGNSGSLVFSLETGKAVGLHFAGSYTTANYAVPSHVVVDRLARFAS